MYILINVLHASLARSDAMEINELKLREFMNDFTCSNRYYYQSHSITENGDM